VNRITALLLVVLSSAAAGPIRSEVRLYLSDPARLRTQLGDLLGELDVCSHGTTDAGLPFLVVNTEAAQLAAIEACGVRTSVIWPDIREKFRAMTGCDPTDGSFRDFGYFFNYWEMRDTLLRLAALHPEIARVDTTMRSHQDRAIWCLKVSDNAGRAEGEPQVFFNGATHAREPMSTHICVAYASLLCQGYGSDPLITWLVDNREVFFVPVMNPDGYVYNSDSGGTSSNWRKNRRVIQSPYVGVDLNRNYGYRWGYDNSGSSPNPSSETYRGPHRFSEPEVEAVHQFMRQHRFRAQIDFHTYGQYNMYPWAYAGDAPPEPELLREVVDTFQMNNGYSRTGQWYNTLYPSNGTSIDWELADTLDEGVPKFVTYAFTCELGISDFWYGAQDPEYVDNEIELNIPNCCYLTRLAGVWLELTGTHVNDSVTGNRTGRLDPGEQADLWVMLQNRALHELDTARSVSAVLSSDDTLVEVLRPGAPFPSMARRSSAGNRTAPFLVRCRPGARPGDTVHLRLEVTCVDAGETIVQPLAARLIIGDSAVGVAEEPAGPGMSPQRRGATIVRGGQWPDRGRAILLDAAGRKLAELPPGTSAVTHLPAGVYFIRSAAPSAFRSRVVVPGR